MICNHEKNGKEGKLENDVKTYRNDKENISMSFWAMFKSKEQSIGLLLRIIGVMLTDCGKMELSSYSASLSRKVICNR